MINGNDPAMPVFKMVGDGTGPVSSVTEPGLTKREYFAAMAMQGILSSNYLMSAIDKKTDSRELRSPQEIASSIAAHCADALIIELNKKEK